MSTRKVSGPPPPLKPKPRIPPKPRIQNSVRFIQSLENAKLNRSSISASKKWFSIESIQNQCILADLCLSSSKMNHSLNARLTSLLVNFIPERKKPPAIPPKPKFVKSTMNDSVIFDCIDDRQVYQILPDNYDIDRRCPSTPKELENAALESSFDTVASTSTSSTRSSRENLDVSQDNYYEEIANYTSDFIQEDQQSTDPSRNNIIRPPIRNLSLLHDNVDYKSGVQNHYYGNTTKLGNTHLKSPPNVRGSLTSSARSSFRSQKSKSLQRKMSLNSSDDYRRTTAGSSSTTTTEDDVNSLCDLKRKSSTIDVDKLIKFKNNTIRLSLSQTIGKIKLKVTSNKRSSNKKDSKSETNFGNSSFYVSKSSSSLDESTNNIEITLKTPQHESSVTNSKTMKNTLSVDFTTARNLSKSATSSTTTTTTTTEETNASVESTYMSQSLLEDVLQTLNSREKTKKPESELTNGRKSLNLLSNLPDLLANSIRITDSNRISQILEDEDPTYACPDDLLLNVSSYAGGIVVDEKQIEDINSGRFDSNYCSRFAFSEPLYQHRSPTEEKNKIFLQRNRTFGEADVKLTLFEDEVDNNISDKSAFPVHLVSTRTKLLNSSQLGSQRTLWCELPEVLQNGLLDIMSSDERKLQEANFEVVTSEASYLRSLNILITHFMACTKLSGNISLGSVINKRERKRLFSNILDVRDASENLLSQLECSLEKSVILHDVSQLLGESLDRFSQVYVTYCSNQLYQERILSNLRCTNPEFCRVIDNLESSPICESLNLRSFLMLPMQRITRYPLLLGAILSRCCACKNSGKSSKIDSNSTEDNGEDDEYDGRVGIMSDLGRENNEKLIKSQLTTEKAFNVASRVVKECNEGARRFERIEQLVQLDKHLLYTEDGPKKLALVSSNRWIVKEENVTELENALKDSAKCRPRRMTLILLTDLLLVCIPVNESCANDSCSLDQKCPGTKFLVKDICRRQFLAVGKLPDNIQLSSNLHKLAPSSSHLFSLTLMTNFKNKQKEIIFLVENERKCQEWLKVLNGTFTKKKSDEEDDNEENGEKIYEIWDCPRAQVIDSPLKNIEKWSNEEFLDVELNDLIDILKKKSNGLIYGQKVSDGKSGWLPANCIQEVMSDHVKARNYRERLKFMQRAEQEIRNHKLMSISSSGTLKRRSIVGLNKLLTFNF
uniref:DH domain-containing protein n=1 Tax=Romanomermis culicivorax TaxID=13658 RepID=A0A915LA24_ROMCU